MEVTLPSGATATFRDVLLRGDIRNARKGMVFLINADGSRRSDGSFLDTVTGNVIRQMMVAWSLGPLPSECQTEELAQQMLDRLPEDDYADLEKAVGPWVERIMRMNKSDNAWIHSATGVRVEVATPEDGQKLAESGDFTREAGADDPKRASIGTGTSSPAAPAATGRAKGGTQQTST